MVTPPGESLSGATKITNSLIAFFADRQDVAMAFLFGSESTGRATQESDVDIAVLLAPDADADEIWVKLERIVGRPVDLVVLNDAPPTLWDAVFVDGIELLVRDRKQYWRRMLFESREAESFRDFVEDFLRIKARSRSLNPADRERLSRILDFLADELADEPSFSEFSRERYESDSGFRRNVERWVENIVNATIDVAKIVLASGARRVPRTYYEAVTSLEWVPGFDRELVGRIAAHVRLRNFLAHEYLDIRYSKISAMLDDEPDLHGRFVEAVRGWMNDEAADH